jgi:hypothetical protein
MAASTRDPQMRAGLVRRAARVRDEIDDALDARRVIDA